MQRIATDDSLLYSVRMRVEALEIAWQLLMTFVEIRGYFWCLKGGFINVYINSNWLKVAKAVICFFVYNFAS